jgi:superfamily II DNA helicase RecQ
MSALRSWRTERARADAIAPFIVAHDSLLVALAEARPATLAELRRIKGMGPAKLERYGDEILATLAAVPR